MADRRWTTDDFDYHLPDDLIAQHPVADRGSSRLLVVRRETGTLEDARFPSIVDLVPPGNVLVVNSTKVRHARLLGARPSGGPAEVLLIHPMADGTWLAMGKPGSAMKPGKVIALTDAIGIETVTVRDGGMRTVRAVGATMDEAIAAAGRLPLPPYISRDPTAEDEDRYQTVYAARVGSVAAPTAGLHFTPAILDALRARGVTIVDLDLEVGPGTFRPVETEDITAHPMHAERFVIPDAAAEAIAAARAREAKVWAVGTTVVRALESAARDDGTVAAGEAETNLMITPGFRFRVVDRLQTNFHLPRSTLLMLVAAFAGHDLMHEAYAHAVAGRYRFYSYGDAMCIL
jgi:S-adenosylmethionine:tRNA ribosyltransferase-isomerase